jgi:hypothetical protein
MPAARKNGRSCFWRGRRRHEEMNRISSSGTSIGPSQLPAHGRHRVTGRGGPDLGGKRGCRPSVLASLGIPEVVVVPAPWVVKAFSVVENLAPAERLVSVGTKMLRQSDDIRQASPPGILIVAVNTGSSGSSACHQRSSRGIADGRRCMRIRKQHTFSCEPVQIRRFHLRMTTERADPVIQSSTPTSTR